MLHPTGHGGARMPVDTADPAQARRKIVTAQSAIRLGACLAAVIAVGSLAARTRTRRRERGAYATAGEQTTVRCCAHHLFMTMWAPESAFTVGRYGPMRMQRCPVAEHWSLVTPADPARLTEEQRSAAAAFHDERLPA